MAQSAVSNNNNTPLVYSDDNALLRCCMNLHIIHRTGWLVGSSHLCGQSVSLVARRSCNGSVLKSFLAFITSPFLSPTSSNRHVRPDEGGGARDRDSLPTGRLSQAARTGVASQVRLGVGYWLTGDLWLSPEKSGLTTTFCKVANKFS